jgi:P2 family phage contractile tail tube protein
VLLPMKLTNFRVYAGGIEVHGLTTVELPKFEAMSDTISGAGIAGEIASPTPGHFGSQSVKFNGRVATLTALSSLAPGLQSFDIRGSIQQQDSMGGPITSQAIRVVCGGQFKSFEPGTLEPGKPMGTGLELELATISIFLDGRPVIELDKLNMIYRVNGVDHLQKVRRDLGGV